MPCGGRGFANCGNNQRVGIGEFARYLPSMPVDLPLEEMSLPDKLQLLETLWNDISRSPEKLPSPDWHQEVLEERRQRVLSGEETLSDWEAAKRDIRKRIS